MVWCRDDLYDLSGVFSVLTRLNLGDQVKKCFNVLKDAAILPSYKNVCIYLSVYSFKYLTILLECLNMNQCCEVVHAWRSTGSMVV